MPAHIPERHVLEIWQSAIRQRSDLTSVADGPVKIIYPGRLNDGRGADLRDAVIATGKGLFRGDIEIHVKSSAWWSHGHHQDPAYNQVILHVVYENDAGKQAILQNGLEVPTLALDGFTEEQAGRRVTTAFTPALPASCRADPELTTRALDEAGEIRFFDKARDFEDELLRDKPGQVLYRGIMTALGYSKNKAPMAKLAEALPLQELEEIAAGVEPENTCITLLQARLLGAAGLLPSQRPVKFSMERSPEHPADEDEAELERIWEAGGGRAQMSFKDWEFFKVRPGNYPTRRIAAIAVLLTRFREHGVLESLKAVLNGSCEDNGRSLESVLMADAEGFWERYTDFGMPARGNFSSLVGKERAGDVIVNVILPFFAAYGQSEVERELKEAAFNTYRCFHAGPENSIERHMRKQLGVPLKSVDTALKRQGLLHIYKTFCTEGRCGECPLGV